MRTMRTIIALLTVLWLASPVLAQEIIIAKKKGGGSQPSYLFSEDFENGNTQWTKSSGTANGNFAYATSPAPLVGSYSLYLDETAGSEMIYRNTTNWTAVTTTYAYAQVNITTVGTVSATTTRLVLGFRDGSNNNVCVGGIKTVSGTVYWVVLASGSSAATAITPVAGTTYHLWLEYIEGSGNGSCSVYVATTGTKPGTPSAARTSLTLTTDAVRIAVGAFLNEVDGVIADKVRVDDAVIGSDPS